MRYTIIKNKNTGERYELGGDVSIICDIMEMGKCICDLVYENEMTGAALIEFLKDHGVNEDVIAKIISTDTYTLTAFDW
jgi:hypothetical protein